MTTMKRKKSRAGVGKKVKSGHGGARAGAGRRPTPFVVAADVVVRTGQEGSRKAALIEVAKSRHPTVPPEKAVERVRKAYENHISDLREAERTQPEAEWPGPDGLDIVPDPDDDADM
jgi:hypothetical protein